MADLDPAHPLDFFQALASEFGTTLAQKRGAPDLADALMQQASTDFETNVVRQCEGQAALACRGGCAACCALRVTATAPEILVVAAYVQGAMSAMPPFGRILRHRIEAAADAAGSLDDDEYLAQERLCPFIVDGHCVIYEVRPLACRGHASFDKAACLDAVGGGDEVVPISTPHHLLRGYVQNALQSALRDAGLAWASYEFVPALAIALRTDASNAWAAGADPFASRRAEDVSPEEMAATFDEIKTWAR
ncbi:YkgJ family cysteine cluster protein [Methylovirgula sp. HY1]|uniref:YkgJ family cysteine cluster protein n=1 Tax=Methylovirgula sp. HY1 TaxID=2822761 RepID=UPI001C5A762C|nr:YkgJ family cysteine cluster protein [Methylovirgula sp. HY1]QXX75196.1 hypothetical protein MHY1_02015 [Methylovirgula sp. HY1]